MKPDRVIEASELLTVFAPCILVFAGNCLNQLVYSRVVQGRLSVKPGGW